MTSSGGEQDFIGRVGGLNAHRPHGAVAPPLLLLLALGKVASGTPRMMSWHAARDGFRELMDRHGNGGDPDDAVFPSVVLQSAGLWEVQGAERVRLASAKGPSMLATLDAMNPSIGLPQSDYDLLRSRPDLLQAAAAVLLVKYFNPVPAGLLEAVQLPESTADCFLPPVGMRAPKRRSIWELYGGQRIQGIGPLPDGITNVFADDEGPYADRLIPETDLIEYRGDGLVGDQQLKAGNRRLKQCQADRAAIRYWHRPAGGEFTFESWVVIVERRYVWGRDTENQWRREFAWILAPVSSPYRDRWPAEVHAYLDTDDGETHDETEGTHLPAGVDVVDVARSYIELCHSVEKNEGRREGRSARAMTNRYYRSVKARLAVQLRADGRCENPKCTGQPADVTDAGDAILEIDHIEDLGRNGRDYPSNMISLCPNCHAIKTRGSTRAALRRELQKVAQREHERRAKLEQ